MTTKTNAPISSPAPTPKYIGLQLDKVHLITPDGELHTIFEHVQLKPAASPTGTDRQLQVIFRDALPNLVTGAVEMLKTMTSPEGMAAAAKQMRLDLPDTADTSTKTAPSKKRPAERTDEELLAIFVEYVRDRPIPYLKRDDELGDDEIGVRKSDPNWKDKRTFIFTATVQAIFPDRNDSRRLVKLLLEREIIRPNPSRDDAATVSVTVNGTARKAYRLASKRYRELLDE